MALSTTVGTPREHWLLHAQRWNRVGPPLRPPPEDVAMSEGAVHAWHVRAGVAEPRAIVLGVTPELVSMRWPVDTRVLSLDLSLAMINGIWPGPQANQFAACSDWRSLPLADASVQLIVGDGSFNALASGAHYRALVLSLRRVIDPLGLLVLRFFVRPERAESVGALIDDLRAQRIGSFHIFKWRLAMALHGDFAAGVRLADIWQVWREIAPNPKTLMKELDWPVSLLETIDSYRGVDTYYTFPTLSEAREALACEFVECSLHTPGYELGSCCPTVELQPRQQ